MNQGGKLAGGNPARGRMENDFYATNPLSTKALLEVENFIGNIYEPGEHEHTKQKANSKRAIQKNSCP